MQIGNQGRVHERIGGAKQSAVGESEPLIGIIRLVHSECAGTLRGIDLRASRAASKDQGGGQLVRQFLAALESGVDGIQHFVQLRERRKL